MAFEIALPYRTDWREMSSVLDYCKGKGADRGALEARFGAGESLRETLNALEQLGLVERGDVGDVRLTMLGEQLAYAPDQTRQRARLVEALAGYPPYRFPLERAVSDAMELLDAPWVEHIWQVDMRLGQPRNRVEEARTLFFRLVDEAGLGTYRRGVRGQTTRLELAAGFAAMLRPILERPPALPAARPDGMRQTAAAGASAPPTPNKIVDVEVGLPTPATTRMPSGVQRAAASPLPAALAHATASGVALTVHVDMSAWELDKIESFLRLVGLLPE